MRECDWPMCLDEQASARLCEEIRREMLGEEIPMSEKDLTDPRRLHQCVTSDPGIEL